MGWVEVLKTQKQEEQQELEDYQIEHNFNEKQEKLEDFLRRIREEFKQGEIAWQINM